jgi:beta-glucanase (GH16 family)
VGTIKTIFGRSYGYKPGYNLNPAAVSNMMVFAGKSDDVQMYRIESITAAGPAGEKPPVDPNTIRVKPQNGFLLGSGVSVNAAKQISSQDAQVSLSGAGNAQLKVVFPAANGEQSITFKPMVGRWDLRDYLELRVNVRNNGEAPISPRVRVDSNGGASEWSSAAPLAPGAQREIVASFINTAPINLSQKDGGNRVINDAVSGVTIAAENANAQRSLMVESIRAALPAPQMLPWLGKRPPVDGDWVKTLDDEFNGTSLDPTIWSVYGENYWDKTSHWSKGNVILGGGMVRLRYQKKTGFNNDDSTQKQSDYASGYLHTYGLWVQRYGYFEARMKMPAAPGLWPAFWMMPDRGVEAGPQWVRQDTGNDGMEFDIMEHLTRWGQNRFNIAMHYDGYGKDHKGVGSDRVYAQPDKDGFVTCGLLWTPGSAIYYYNGREVARWENVRISNVPSILMFTLPMGGWDNNSLDDTKLPDDFIIDYVRVWQRKDLASAVDGKKTPSASQPKQSAPESPK